MVTCFGYAPKAHKKPGDNSPESLAVELYQLLMLYRSDAKAFIDKSLKTLFEYIPCDWCSVGVLDHRRRLLNASVYPGFFFDTERIIPALDAYMHEQEALTYLEKTAFSPVSVSLQEAFLRKGKSYKESGLFNEAYKHLFCEDQIGAFIYVEPSYGPVDSPLYIFINFVRASGRYGIDCGHRERADIDRKLAIAYTRVFNSYIARDLFRNYLAALRIQYGMDHEGEASILCDSNGSLVNVTPQARMLLDRHFPFDSSETELPPEFRDWIRSQKNLNHNDGYFSFHRIRESGMKLATASGTTIVVNLGKGITQTRLSMEEIDDTEALVSLMTKRQKEVLSGLCLGYTHEGIARLLGISIKTVEEHVNNLGKLTNTKGNFCDRRLRMAVRFSRNHEILILCKSMGGASKSH